MTNSTDPTSHSRATVLDRFLAKLPADIAASFNQKQLEAMQTAFMVSPADTHQLDIRHSFALLGRQYYLVLLLGKDRRMRRRLETTTYSRKGSTVGRLVSTGLAVGLLATVCLSTTYLVTSMLGINLLPKGYPDNLLFSHTVDPWPEQ